MHQGIPLEPAEIEASESIHQGINGSKYESGEIKRLPRRVGSYPRPKSSLSVSDVSVFIANIRNRWIYPSIDDCIPCFNFYHFLEGSCG